jgi:carbon starvation protein
VWWVWLVTGVPTVFMYVMSTWALFTLTWPAFRGETGWVIPREPVPWIGLVLMVLAVLMLIEAIRILLTLGASPPAGKLEPATVPAGAAAS